MLGISTGACLQICYTLREANIPVLAGPPKPILEALDTEFIGRGGISFNGVGRSVVLLKHSTFLPICLLCNGL